MAFVGPEDMHPQDLLRAAPVLVIFAGFVVKEWIADRRRRSAAEADSHGRPISGDAER